MTDPAIPNEIQLILNQYPDYTSLRNAFLEVAQRSFNQPTMANQAETRNFLQALDLVRQQELELANATTARLIAERDSWRQEVEARIAADTPNSGVAAASAAPSTSTSTVAHLGSRPESTPANETIMHLLAANVQQLTTLVHEVVGNNNKGALQIKLAPMKFPPAPSTKPDELLAWIQEVENLAPNHFALYPVGKYLNASTSVFAENLATLILQLPPKQVFGDWAKKELEAAQQRREVFTWKEFKKRMVQQFRLDDRHGTWLSITKLAIRSNVEAFNTQFLTLRARYPELGDEAYLNIYKDKLQDFDRHLYARIEGIAAQRVTDEQAPFTLTEYLDCAATQWRAHRPLTANRFYPIAPRERNNASSGYNHNSRNNQGPVPMELGVANAKHTVTRALSNLPTPTTEASRCFRCGSTEHWANKCPQKPNNNGQGNRRYNPNQQRPQGKGQGQGQPAGKMGN